MNQNSVLNQRIAKGEIIAIFGLPGSGKTSLLLLLKLLPLWKKMFFLDMSALLQEAVNSESPTAEDSAVIEAMKGGQLAPDDFVLRTLFRKVNRICDQRNDVTAGFITGIPRTGAQQMAVSKAGWNGSLRAGYITCKRETAFGRVVNRNGKCTRLDGEPSGLEGRFKRRCDDFENHTLPVVRTIQNEHRQNYFEIDDGATLREKARTVVTFLAGSTKDRNLKDLCAESLVALHENDGKDYVNEALAYYENPGSLPEAVLKRLDNYFHMTPLVG